MSEEAVGEYSMLVVELIEVGHGLLLSLGIDPLRIQGDVAAASEAALERIVLSGDTVEIQAVRESWFLTQTLMDASDQVLQEAYRESPERAQTVLKGAEVLIPSLLTPEVAASGLHLQYLEDAQCRLLE